MDLMKAMEERHSVRSYTDKPIEGEVKDSLVSFIDKCAADSGLTIRLVLDEEKAFDSFMAHYGKFSGVRNYVVLAGRKTVQSLFLWDLVLMALSLLEASNSFRKKYSSSL